MHSWKKKLVVSQLALACTLAITSQANATTYNTFGYHDDAVTLFNWGDNTKTDHDYLTYGAMYTTMRLMVILILYLVAIPLMV